MKYRELGTTGLQVSVIGVGTWQFGGEWGHAYEQSEVDRILDCAAESGINLIDTAECYGDHLSESLIGDYLARRPGHQWIVATKFGHQFHGFMDRTWHVAPDAVQNQLEISLRSLRVDAIDLYQFHSGTDEAFQTPGLWEMLEQQRKAGKIRHLGVSISSNGGEFQAQQARRSGAEVLQVVYNRLERRAEQTFFPHAQRDRLGILARVPLASGFLSGKFKSADGFSANDVRATFDREKMQRWLSEIESIRARELPPGMPMSQWALAWCLKTPLVSAVIPGCKNVDQVRANALAADLDV